MSSRQTHKAAKRSIAVGKSSAIVISSKKKAPTNKNLDKRIRRMQNKEEVKHVDTVIPGVTMVSIPIVAQTILLNGFVQGNANSTRIGDQVTSTSIQMKGNITMPSVATITTPTTWRIIVFRDMQSNGVAPTAAMLLDVSTITHYYIAPYNSDYTHRFRVIFDKRGTINPNYVGTFNVATGVTTAQSQTIQKISFKRRIGFSVYNGLGNAGTIADIAKNAIYVLLISDIPTGSGPPTLEAGFRYNYKDD